MVWIRNIAERSMYKGLIPRALLLGGSENFGRWDLCKVLMSLDA